MSAGKEAPEQKAIRLLNAAFRIKEPFNLDKPGPRMWAVSVFTLEKLIELALAEEREANIRICERIYFEANAPLSKDALNCAIAIRGRIAAPKAEVSKGNGHA